MTASERERFLGIGLLVAAAICLLLAIMIGWNGINRWRAIHAADAWQMARLAGNANDAADAAQRAAHLGSGDAALVLPAIDVNDADPARLDRLRREVPAAQRRLIDATLAFHTVLHGGQGGNLDGVNGRLLDHVAALKRGGGIPTFPAVDRGNIPFSAILAHAVQTHIQAAWNAGDPVALRAGLEAFVLLRPDHAEHGKARLVLAAITGATTSSFMHDFAEDRQIFLRDLALLVPERADALIRLIPEHQRTPNEIQRLLLAGGESVDLQQQVEQALANPGEAVFAVLFRRCLADNNTDLAQQLIEKAPASIKPAMELALAFHAGDVATVARLQPERRDLQPRITTPFGRENLITFHLMTDAGLIPRGDGLEVRLNDERVAAERINRRGSLVEIQFRGDGLSVNFEVKLSEMIVFAGPVKL